MIEEFIALSEERKAQKLRGLNNYNILTAVRNANAEVGMHSNFLYSLLNPEGDHYQGELFVRLFAKYVLDIQNLGKNIKVIPEFASENRRIDFVFESDTYMVGIEMKIDAEDQDKQIADYYDYLVKNAKDKTVKMYYLTPHIKKASEKSHRNRPYTQISFKDHIIKWLNEVQKQVSNITNLNNAIEYYRDVVKMITGKYESPLFEYKDFFLDKEKGEERFKFFKNEENKKELQKSIDDYDQMVRGFEDAKTTLEQYFYKKLLTPILNERLVFDQYINMPSTRQVRLLLDGQYLIRLHLNKAQTNIESIQFEVAWFNKKDNPEKNDAFKTIQQKISTIEKLQPYINSMGVKLKDVSIPESTDENLFSSWKGKKIFQFDNQSEICKYLDYITEILTKREEQK